VAQRSILISDDDPHIVAAMTRLALAGGFAVIPDLTSNVVELAEKHHPNVIVLDIGQSVDGRVLLGALQRSRNTRDIPVVVLTGEQHPMIRTFCLALGAKAFQQKPVDRTFVRLLGDLAGIVEPPKVEEEVAS
jgi:CheY-like chemotaxis protein